MSHHGLALGAPGGGAGGDGAAGELCSTTRAVASFLPTVLKKPAFGRDLRDVAASSETFAGVREEAFVFVSNMLEGPTGDKLGFLAQRGGIELCRGGGGVEVHAPANLVRHPVADAREAGLVENEGFEAGARAFFQKLTHAGEGEAAVEDFGGKACPRLGILVEMSAAELAVVVVNEGEVGEPKEEVVVLVGLVVGGSDGKAAGHSEMDLEGEDLVLLLKSEEKPLAVRAAGDHLSAGEGGLNGDRGSVAVDPGLRVGLDRDHLFPQRRGPNTAGKFDFSEFRHGRPLVSLESSK